MFLHWFYTDLTENEIDGIDHGSHTDVDIPPLPPTPIRKQPKHQHRSRDRNDRDLKVKNLPQHVPYLPSPQHLSASKSLQNNNMIQQTQNKIELGSAQSLRNLSRLSYNPDPEQSQYNTGKYATITSPLPKQRKYEKQRRKSLDQTDRNHHQNGNQDHDQDTIATPTRMNLLTPDSSQGHGSPKHNDNEFQFGPFQRAKSRNIDDNKRHNTQQMMRHRGQSHHTPRHGHHQMDSMSVPEYDAFLKSAPHPNAGSGSHGPHPRERANVMAKSKSSQHMHQIHSVVIDRNSMEINLQDLPSATSNLSVNKKKPLDVERIQKKLMDHNMNAVAKLNTSLPSPTPTRPQMSRKERQNQGTPPPPIPDDIHKFEPHQTSNSMS